MITAIIVTVAGFIIWSIAYSVGRTAATKPLPDHLLPASVHGFREDYPSTLKDAKELYRAKTEAGNLGYEMGYREGFHDGEYRRGYAPRWKACNHYCHCCCSAPSAHFCISSKNLLRAAIEVQSEMYPAVQDIYKQNEERAKKVSQALAKLSDAITDCHD